jgi:hypothetical protein
VYGKQICKPSLQIWRKAPKISVGKSQVKMPFGRPRCRWENNKMGIRELWSGFMPPCLWTSGFCVVSIEPSRSINAEN